MGEAARVLHLVAVEGMGCRRLAREVGQLGHARLHPEGQLVLLDAGVRLRVAHDLVVHLVERLQAVERLAADLGRDTVRVVDIKDRVATGAERDAGVLAREVARRPEPGRDRLHLLGVRGPGDQDDERGQVVVHRPQAIRHPGAEAGPARVLVAGLHVGDRRLVVDRLGVHAPDEAQVVDHPGRVGEHLRDPHAALAVLLELVLRGSDREPLLAARHGREPLAHPHRVGKLLVVPLVHHRLVVVEVHLRRPADHVQVDDVLRLRGEVGQPGQRPGRRRPVAGAGAAPQSLVAQQRGQGGPAHGIGPPAEELAAGLILDVFLERAHSCTSDYLLSTSSRFISSFVSMVQAARAGGSQAGSAFDSPTATSSAASLGCAA